MYSRKSAAFIISFLVVLTPICKSHAEGQDNQNKEGSVLSLVDAEKWAIQNSYDSKISEVFIEGFDQKIKSIGSHRYPKLVVEGSYKYLETVPALTTMSTT